jgi:DNA-binding XRE family transcriptional regulator
MSSDKKLKKSKMFPLGKKKKEHEEKTEISNPQSDHTYTRNYENQTKHLKVALSNQVQNTMMIREEFRELNNKFDVEVLSRRKAEAEQEDLSKKLAALRSKVISLEKQQEQEKMRTAAIMELFGCENMDSSSKRATLGISRGLRDPLQRNLSTGNTLTFRKGKMPEIYSIVNQQHQGDSSPRGVPPPQELSKTGLVKPVQKPRLPTQNPPIPSSNVESKPKVLSSLPRPPPRRPSNVPPIAVDTSSSNSNSSTSETGTANAGPESSMQSHFHSPIIPTANHSGSAGNIHMTETTNNNNNNNNNQNDASKTTSAPLGNNNSSQRPAKITPMRPLFKPAPPKTPPPIFNSANNNANNN